MSDLPRDIIIDILSRLPVKSLGQFMSVVCKSWFSLISSPDFVKLHHNRSISDPNTNHFRILLMSTHSLNSIDFESPSCYEYSNSHDVKAIVDLEHPVTGELSDKLFGSCYGLIYFVCYQECIILWNPCTQKTRKLPNLSSTSFSDATSFYGLGYDSSAGDYKMVRTCRSVSGNSTKSEIFSLRSDESWRSMVQAFHLDIAVSEDEEGIFFNGALHWQGIRGSGSHEKRIILSLDMREEKFEEISLPDIGDEKILFYCLGNLNKSLSLVCGGDGNDAEIWVMKEYGVEKSWSKLINLSWVGFDCCYGLLPVCFTMKGDVVVDLDGWHLERFNIKEKTAKRFKKCSTDWHDWVMYMECLVSPYG